MKDVFYKAKEFGISNEAACRMKARFYLDRVDTYYDDGFYLEMAKRDIWAVLDLFKECNKRSIVYTGNSNFSLVTDEMKEIALAYPIDKLIHFVNGKAIAWCHDDKRPSLVHNKKHNKAWCPVCNKQFNPIDVAMVQNGLKYYNAIRLLQ